jgi:signal transduction histidine kinase
MRATDVLTTETDVSRKQQSIESFTTIERICATVAHELKNPVNNILLSATAMTEMGLNEEQASFLEMIRRNTERINNLLTELVEATHITQLAIEPVNICDLVDEALLMIKDEVSAASISIKRNYPTAEHHLQVDRARMKKALQQLLSNAVEAMDGSAGLLELTIWGDEDEAFIELKDNGSGIAEDLQSQIFEPYFTTKQGKRGMGLPLAQTIILSHGGSLTVHSYPPRGTTIVLRLRSTVNL